jgi:hypothetical protein
VLRIRDVYPVSDFFPFRIPDPPFFPPGFRIRIEEFKYFNPNKWFLSSRKYVAGCSSRIPDPDPYFFPIPDPGSMGQKGTGSRIRTTACIITERMGGGGIGLFEKKKEFYVQKKD